MKDRVRSFLVFTTLGYRIIAFLVIPVLGIWFGHLFAKEFMMPGYLLSAYLLVPVEIMIDHFIFGGICAKDVSHLEYLKSSKRGEWVTESALIGGIARILLTMLVVFVGNQISFFILFPNEEYTFHPVLVPIALLLCAFGVIMIFIIVSRFLDMLFAHYVLATGGALLVFKLAELIEQNVNLGLIVGAILAIAGAVVNVKVAMWRIKESYHDKTVADGI